MNKRAAPQPLASTEQETQPLDDSLYEDLPRSEFLQLPQEEQDRLYQLRQQRVREASTLYEWDIRVATVYGMGWLVVIIPCGIMVLIGLVAHWYESDQWYGFFFMALIFAPFIRYLWLADKQYHYRLTTEGLVTTYHDTIPDAAYAVVRGLAWFGVVVCIVGVAFLGPAALIGAGGMALGAFFFTGFKNVETTSISAIKRGHPHMIKVTHKRPYISCDTDRFYFGYYSNLDCYCHPEDMHKVLSLLMKQLPGSELFLLKNERIVGLSKVGTRDGEPVQLSDFAPENTQPG
ncbi:hypothetical protein [Shewanella sp. SM32]|uniref:hypothetical protein n=1 Tax=Shewanella sp. SM32 TaxID=2912796 RepID=UPI0021DB6270|nr:hypothetical protein [Shewanella sp. SM32]MCU8068979.1 hypothetical protein [Shewanella sp. SM32]